MKIYQLHKYGGEWEDRYDYIVGSYLRKERAEEEKSKLDLKEKELLDCGVKCQNCPIYTEDFDNFEALEDRCHEYCDKALIIDYKDGEADCAYYDAHWDEAYFRIEEVEVIE